MTKADLLDALHGIPDTAEIRLAAAGTIHSTSCILRVEAGEIWLGDRETLSDELAESDTTDPSETDSILWHNPDHLPRPSADLAACALALTKTTY